MAKAFWSSRISTMPGLLFWVVSHIWSLQATQIMITVLVSPDSTYDSFFFHVALLMRWLCYLSTTDTISSHTWPYCWDFHEIPQVGISRSFYTITYTHYLYILMFTLRLSGSSALPAYPGFMVMKTAQVGFRESSVPSKMKVFSFRIMACWMLRICWATTDSTSTWRENTWLMWAPACDSHTTLSAFLSLITENTQLPEKQTFTFNIRCRVWTFGLEVKMQIRVLHPSALVWVLAPAPNPREQHMMAQVVGSLI